VSHCFSGLGRNSRDVYTLGEIRYTPARARLAQLVLTEEPRSDNRCHGISTYSVPHESEVQIETDIDVVAP
jgi:hypothetical protein